MNKLTKNDNRRTGIALVVRRIRGCASSNLERWRDSERWRERESNIDEGREGEIAE